MPQLEQVLPGIIKSLKSTYGNDFFNTITLQLSKIIGADYTFIAQVDLVHHTAKTISLVAKNQLTENFEYDLTDTPCATLTHNNICLYPKKICSLFPKDQLLIDMEIEGYVGVPLQDSQGNVIGIIVTLHKNEITDTDFIKTLFELFSGRIAAEIERKKQAYHLEQLNAKLTAKVDELIRSEAKLSLHLQNTPLGCITWDKNFYCTEWNKAAEKIFGYSATEAIGKHANELIVPFESRSKIHNIYDSLQNQTGGQRSANENITKAGKTIKCDWYNTAIITKEGVFTGISSLTQDITERDYKEQLLRRSQKMDALGMLTSGIAHDQNNILGIITGYSDLLSLKLTEQPKLLNYVKQIQQASKRSALLIQKLLSFSKSKSQSLEKVKLNKFLIEQQDMLQKAITVQVPLTFELADNLWPVWLDKNDLADAIINLCINAVHAMKNSSSPHIKILSQNITLNQLNAEDKGVTAGDYVILSVTDNGCGINNEHKEKIFDPFFSTKGENGTGLGLSQVFSFVTNSHGCIHLGSQTNQGAEFILYFPRYQKQQHNKVTLNEIKRAPLKGNETILVVDDEESLRKLASEFLTMAGYKVFCADGYFSALEVLKSQQIDLMLSDVVMPKKNGYQLASTVKNIYPKVKIQLISGHADSVNVTALDKSLQKKLILKPYDYKELTSKISTLLHNDKET